MISVLLVDDEALTLELHRDYIARLDGFTVVAECTGAHAAIEAVLSRPDIDLVLLDMTMPDGSGVDVLRHVRARGSAVDVIAVTGVRDAEAVRQTVGLGVVQYLVKPVTFAVFADRMAQYRDFHRRTQESSGPSTQEEIDALLSSSRATGAVRVPSLPKGLAAHTLERVTAAVREARAVSAKELAERLGMSRVAARRYLEHLVTVERLDRVARYGGQGRPETEYRWRS
ncbi:response regulator [Microbacterium sp. LjRoot45]|uniref:response regulator n=1 Tax=Microbacterium sp. LjRoot45 TaxID=3342329 RepID=UPI003ED10F41